MDNPLLQAIMNDIGEMVAIVGFCLGAVFWVCMLAWVLVLRFYMTYVLEHGCFKIVMLGRFAILTLSITDIECAFVLDYLDPEHDQYLNTASFSNRMAIRVVALKLARARCPILLSLCARGFGQKVVVITPRDLDEFVRRFDEIKASLVAPAA